MFSHRHAAWLVILMFLAAACAPAAIDLSATPAPSPQTPATDPSPSPQSGQGTPLDQAIADLSARLNVPALEIEVVSEEEVVWPDGSLGCPQPGMNYVQILVEGYRIVLAHGDQTYDYHAGPSSVILCEQPLPMRKPTLAPGAAIAQPSPNQNPADTFLIYGIRDSGDATPSGSRSAERYSGDVTEAAITHLASRLGVPVDSIDVVTREYVETQMASPCGATAKSETGAMPDGLSLGYEIVLRVGEARYRYLAIGGLGHYCGEL